MATDNEALDAAAARREGIAPAPYAASAVDRFMAWVDELPGPAWAAYPAFLVVLILFVNAVAWLDGSQPVATFDLYRTSVAVYPVAALAAMHHLNRVARRALADFRPALGATDAAFMQWEYELTTLPRRSTWAVLGLSILFTAAFALLAPNRADLFSHVSWLAAVDVAIYLIVFGLVAVFVFHALRQLRMVSRFHEAADNVDLFQLTPLYAFSRLTARTGMAVLALNYFSALTDPATFENPALIGLTVLSSVAAVAIFVLPLKGMHDRITAEKRALSAEANTRLQETIAQLYRRADARRLAGIEQLNQLLASLVTTREVLAKIPSWPWDTGTLTGFVSALLPAIAGLSIFVLEQLVVIRLR